jgi:hypothetical protein
MTDCIDRAVAVSDYLTARHLPATQDNINAAFRALDEATATPVNGYDAPLAALRAAGAPLSTFETNYRAARQREMDAMRESLDAEARAPHLTTAEELATATPPNPYEKGLAALRAQR